MHDVFSTKPEFVNELGVKWWRDEDMTKYVQKPDVHGTSLDMFCFFIEEPNGRRSRVLVSKDAGIVEEDQNLEALAIKIDVRKFLIRDHLKYPEKK